MANNLEEDLNNLRFMNAEKNRVIELPSEDLVDDIEENVLQHIRQSIILKDKILDMLSRAPFSYECLLWYKDNVSTQKFSPWFQEMVAFLLDHENKTNFGVFDAIDHRNSDTYEYKYATMIRDKLSFPQMFRLNYACPNWYLIVIFEGDNLIVSKIPGAEMHAKMGMQRTGSAHSGNGNELRMDVSKWAPYRRGQEYSYQYKFLLSYRDSELEEVLKSSMYSLK
jgi:hypothetical protein